MSCLEKIFKIFVLWGVKFGFGYVDWVKEWGDEEDDDCEECFKVFEKFFKDEEID